MEAPPPVPVLIKPNHISERLLAICTLKCVERLVEEHLILRALTPFHAWRRAQTLFLYACVGGWVGRDR